MVVGGGKVLDGCGLGGGSREGVRHYEVTLLLFLFQ